MSAGTQRYWIRNLGYYIAVITSLCKGNGNDVLNKDRFTMSFRIIEVQHQATHPINTTTQRASSTTRVGMNEKEGWDNEGDNTTQPDPSTYLHQTVTETLFKRGNARGMKETLV